MMRTIILSAALTMAASFFSSAYDTSYEPESETAVSYTAFDDLKSWQTAFVNYAKADGSNEYWIRVSVKIENEKVLHYCILNLDGKDYPLYIMEPHYKHIRAGSAPYYSTAFAQPANNFQVFASDSVYFPLSSDLVQKILSAKEVRLEFNRIRRLHNHVKIGDDMLGKIKEHFQLKYTDFDKYWDPKNQDGSAD